MDYIYRVSDNDDMGCYQSGGTLVNGLEHHEGCDPIHPHPLYDVGIKRYPIKEERHAFESIEQAEKWFTKVEFKRMESNGYKLRKIPISKVDITAVGDCQILFKYND